MIQLGGKSFIILSLNLVSHENGKANKMCLTETYNRAQVGKNLSDMSPIRNGLKQGDVLSPLLFNFVL